MQQRTMGFSLASALTAVTLFAGAPVAQAQSNGTNTKIDSGTVIPLVFDKELASNKARKGDRFSVKVKTTDRTYLGIPEGTRIEGVITEATAKHDKEPGVLDMQFDKLRLPDGRAYALSGDLVNLDNKSVNTDEDGRITAKSGKKQDTKFIGYGAAAGALFSIIGNKGRLSLENLILGAGAGYAASALGLGTKSEPRDVVLKPGTSVGLRLDKPLRLPVLNREDLQPSEREDRGSSDRGTEDKGDERDSPATPADRSDFDFAVMVGDKDVYFNTKAKPYKEGDTWMIPVKPVFDKAYVISKYNSSSRQLQVTHGPLKVKASVGSQVAVMGDGSRRRMDKALREQNGEVYAPVRFFELVLGRRASFDRSSNTLLFSSANDR